MRRFGRRNAFALVASAGDMPGSPISSFEPRVFLPITPSGGKLKMRLLNTSKTKPRKHQGGWVR